MSSEKQEKEQMDICDGVLKYHKCNCPEPEGERYWFGCEGERYWFGCEGQVDYPLSGVCDYPDQVKEKYPELIQNVWFKPILRSDQESEWGGWRWRKWGQYIGEYSDDHRGEYLYASDGRPGHARIDRQWIFKIGQNFPEGSWFGPPWKQSKDVSKEEQDEDRTLLKHYKTIDLPKLNKITIESYRQNGKHYDPETKKVTEMNDDEKLQVELEKQEKLKKYFTEAILLNAGKLSGLSSEVFTMSDQLKIIHKLTELWKK